MNNIYRLLSVLIYPVFVGLLLYYICSKRFNNELKKHKKEIIVNTLIILILGIIGIFVYFRFETNAVYVYDDAGYYVKSLKLLQIFWNDPSLLFSKVYSTINQDDYSYLPSLFNFWELIINNSYWFYCIVNYVLFLMPTYFLLLCLYYKHFDNKYLPIIYFFVFYPLWLTILYGRVDCLGLFPLLIFYIIAIFGDYKDISKIDVFILNILTLVLMFERRWYLYALVGAYLAYLIKDIVYAYKNKDWLKSSLKFILSGFIALVILLLFFRGFITNVMTVNNVEAYSFYNHSGKVSATINFYSIIICLLVIYGIIRLFIKDKVKCVSILVTIIIPCALFWKTQSFDLHHYLIICLSMLILFVLGIENIPYQKYSKLVICVLLIVQVCLIFTDVKLPLLTKVKKTISSNPYKDDLFDISEYLKEISKDDGIYTYVAFGNNYLCDDSIKNVGLPDVDFPNMVSFIFDVRDGFPKDFGYIKYFVISDPIIYMDEDYQHMYKIISEAIMYDESISKIFTMVNEFALEDDTKVYVYELTGEYTSEMKEYFYKKMLEYYPDKADFYRYILD